MSGFLSNENNTSVPFPCRITVIQATGEAGKSFEFDTKTWCVLGSHPDCDIRIKHNLRAPLHALVFVRPDGVHLQGIHSDIPVVHSRTGTNLVKENEIPLLPGDNFYLGDRGFRVDFDSPSHLHLKSSTLSNPEVLRPRTRGARKAATERKNAHRNQMSERKQKPKRRVSLVVEAYGEKFVAQNRDTERLLSQTQRARLSDGEGFTAPVKSDTEELNTVTDANGSGSKAALACLQDNGNTFAALEPRNDKQDTESEVILEKNDQKTTQEAIVQDVNRGVEHSDSKGTSDEKVSRFSTPKTKNSVRMTKSASKQGTLTARERKNLIYSRLSLGLSALPGKNEIASELKNNTTVVFASRAPVISEGNLEFDELQRSVQESNELTGEKNLIRSPLTDKSPILNIQSSSIRSGNLIKESRTPSAIKKSPGGVLRSSKSTTRAKKRSVVFASRIELERGTHYSPFRPSRPRTNFFPTGNVSLADQNTSIDSTDISLSPAGTPPDFAQSEASCAESDNATFKMEKNTTIAAFVDSDYASQKEKGASDAKQYVESSTDVPESVTDSNSPQTSSSADSSSSRLTGAISSLFKRLSGNKEQQLSENIGNDKGLLGKPASTERDIRELGKDETSTEPLMSADEIQDLSTSKQMSVSRRLSFFEKVIGAAAAVRNVMNDVDDDLHIAHGEKAETLPNASTREADSVKMNEGSARESLLCSTRCSEELSPRGDILSNAEKDERTTPRSDFEIEESIVPNSEEEPKSEDEHRLSSGVQSDAISSGRGSSLNGSISNPSPGNILARLTRGIGMSASSTGEDSADKLSENSEETESLDYSISSDGNSCDSQDSADTFERELEIRVNRASFQLCPPGSADVQDFEEVIPKLLKGHLSSDASPKDVVDSCGGDDKESTVGGPERSAASATPRANILHSDQGDKDCEGDVEVRPEANETTIAENDTQESADQDTITVGPSHESVPIGHVGGSQSSNCCDDLHGPDFPGSEKYDIEPSQKAECGANSIRLDDQAAQKDDTEDLEAQLNKLYVADLREKLRAMNASTAGRKTELVKRLKEIIMERVASSEYAKDTCTDEEINDTLSEDSEGVAISEKEATESEAAITDVPNADEESSEVKTENEAIADLYRKKTVKELRQILKDHNLDIMSKLRKEDLIQHMIAEGIKLPEQEEDDSGAESPSSERVLRSTRKTRQTPATSRRGRPSAVQGSFPTAKALNRLTVAELRLRLKEQSLCLQGTKKVLIDRILSGNGGEDENAAPNSAQNNSCKSCGAGQLCEMENKA